MKLNVKSFDELTAFELYKIYKARVAVFVVEQTCPYQEVDDADRTAIHLWLEDDQQNLVAYARVLPSDGEKDVSIGRVLSLRRRKGLGTKIVEAAIREAQERFHPQKISVEAQTYAKKLYENLGFEQVSDEFLLDDIPHIRMTLSL